MGTHARTLESSKMPFYILAVNKRSPPHAKRRVHHFKVFCMFVGNALCGVPQAAQNAATNM